MLQETLSDQDHNNLDWEIVERAVMYRDLNDANNIVTDHDRKVLIRSDTHEPLTTVRKQFKIVQPREIVNFYEELANQMGFKMGPSGYTRNGIVVWGQAETPLELRLPGDDRVKSHILLHTANDGTAATTLRFISKRLNCNNMLNAALNNGSEWALKIRHTSQVNFKKLIEQLKDLAQFWAQFEENAAQLSQNRLTDEEAYKFFIKVLAEKDGKVSEKTLETVLPNVIDIFKNAPGQQVESAEGTMWGAVNAVTYFTDHVKRAHSDHNRFREAYFGKGNKLKNKAYTLALAA